MNIKKFLTIILLTGTSLALLHTCVNNNKTTEQNKSGPIDKKNNTTKKIPPRQIRKQKPSKLKKKDSKSKSTEKIEAQTLKTEDTSIPISFYVLNINQGEIIAKQSSTDPSQLKLPWKETRGILSSYLISEYINVLDSKIKIDGNNESWILIKDLNSKEVTAYYLETDLSVRVSIDFSIVKPEKLSLKDDMTDLDTAKQFVHPAKISGYQNFNVNESIRSGNYSDSSFGRQKYNIRHDGALNVSDWILQNEGYIQEGSEYRRGDIKLVHDDVSNMVRYSAGDITPSGGGFMDAKLIFGVGASRNFSLQPNYNYNQISSSIITLKKNGMIRIYANKVLIQSLSKFTGKYDIRDFPMLVGLNDVQLEIQYDDGEIERLEIPSFNFSPDLLGEGQNQFGYYAGVPQSGGSYILDSSNPVIELSDKYGLSNKLNIGGYTQTTPHFSIFGGSLDYASAIGIIRLENALSFKFNDKNTFGVGTKASYQYSKGSTTFNVFVERRGYNFYTFGNTLFENPSFYRFSSTLNQKLNENTSVSMFDSYGITKTPGTKNPIELSLGLNKNILRNLQFSSIMRKSIGLINEVSMSLELSWRLSENEVLSSSYSPGGSLNAQYNNKLSKELDEQAGFTSGPDQKSLNGRIGYQGERANSSFSTDETFIESGHKVNNTSLNLATAVAFAGNAVAITSPIYDSFALVRAEGRLKREKISINDNRNPNFFGPATLTNMNPYQENTVNINSNEMTQGIALKKDSYTLVPTYKSGTLIELETESLVSVHGILVDEKNNPLSLVSGKITNISNKTKEEFFFTNETGEFFIERLESVDYEVILFDKTGSKQLIHIPTGFEGVFQCGTLVVKPKTINKAGN